MGKDLEVRGLDFGYTSQLVLRDVSFTLPAGTTLALVGANGAGKTTLAATLAGLLHPSDGEIRFGGRDITTCTPMRRVDLGIALVPEGRSLFPDLSVHDNLRLGAWRRRKDMLGRLEETLELFPILRTRARQQARTLSGGEQQMLAIGRALMGAPELLILDEPSLGLAPIPTRLILQKVGELNQQGVSVLLIEQNAVAALDIADRGVVLERGVKKLDDNALVVRTDPAVIAAYLGGVA